MSNFLVNEKIILTNNSSNQDAFDRLRISEPNALFEYDLSLGKLPFLIDEFVSTSGATIMIDTSIPTIDLKLTGESTGKVIRQSFEYVPYQPGKSKLMLFSGVLEAEHGGITGVVSRIGSFDSSVEKGITGNGNGLFFELGGESGKTLSVVERLNNTDTKVSQTNWNSDKFDGTGPSGITALYFSKAMIFAIDQEWLGTGRVRFGFVINGSFKLAHVFNHSGIGTPTSTGIQVPYTKTAKLPIRYEISSTIANTATLRMLTSTVLSEGGFEPTGMSFSKGTTSGHTLATNLAHPIISIKLIGTEPYNRKTVSLRKISTIIRSASGTPKQIQWDLYMLPNENSLLGTPNWQNVNTNSIVQYDINATGITGLGSDNIILLASGYADVSTINDFYYDKYLASPLINSSINGTSKVLCLSAIRLNVTGNNPIVNSSLSWVEIL